MSDTPRTDAVKILHDASSTMLEVREVLSEMIASNAALSQKLAQAKAELAAERKVRADADYWMNKYTEAATQRNQAMDRGNKAECRAEEAEKLLREMVGEMMHFAVLDGCVRKVRAYLNAKEGKNG